jgi:hypothetical protein
MIGPGDSQNSFNKENANQRPIDRFLFPMPLRLKDER